MITTIPYYLNLSGKNFCQELLRPKNFRQKLRHQVVEAEALRVEAEAFQKLPPPHP